MLLGDSLSCANMMYTYIFQICFFLIPGPWISKVRMLVLEKVGLAALVDDSLRACSRPADRRPAQVWWVFRINVLRDVQGAQSLFQARANSVAQRLSLFPSTYSP